MKLSTTLPPEPLSEREVKLLTRLEADIEENLKGFKIVGYSLVTIRDQRLYRQDYETFEAYCLEEWDISRPRAYQLIDYFEVIDTLSTMVDKSNLPLFKILPLNERQARPLVYIPMEQQGEAWAMVIEEADKTETRITASFIQRCIDIFRQKKASKTIRNARNTSSSWTLPDSFQRSYQSFMDELQKNTDETFEKESRKEIAKILREILSTIEN